MSVTEARLQKQTADIEELIASHGSARSLTDFAQYADRPVEFMREVLHFDPWEKQIEIAMSVVHNKRTVARGAHGMGKDAVLAPIMLWAAYARGMLVLGISATEKQLLGQLWKELTDRFNDAGDLPGQLFTADLRIAGEKRIIAMTSGSISNLTGWHDKHGVFVAISEGQGEQTEAAAFDAANTNTTDDLSRIVVAGNPYKPEGRFFEIHSKSTWHKIKISAFDHPNIVQGRMVILGGPSPSWPAEMAEEYGVDSAFYVGRVLAEFPDTSIDSLVQRSWLTAAAERWHERMMPVEKLREPLRLALDVAGPGVDKNVLGYFQGTLLREFESWREPDLMKTARHVRARQVQFGRVRPWQPEPVAIVDVNGLGLGVYNRIREIEVNEVKGRALDFNGSFRQKGVWWTFDTKRFLNLRAAAYWNLRELLERGRAALPDDPELHEELIATEWTTNSAGLIQILEKKLVKAKLPKGRSPDKADVTSMGLLSGGGGVSVVHFAI